MRMRWVFSVDVRLWPDNVLACCFSATFFSSSSLEVFIPVCSIPCWLEIEGWSQLDLRSCRFAKEHEWFLHEFNLHNVVSSCGPRSYLAAASRMTRAPKLRNAPHHGCFVKWLVVRRPIGRAPVGLAVDRLFRPVFKKNVSIGSSQSIGVTNLTGNILWTGTYYYYVS